MAFGLLQRDMDHLIQAFQQFPEIECAVIFGSRAKGNAQPGSDIDLALKGEAITNQTVTRLKSVLEDLPIPYFFDVLDYATIQNKALQEHIDRIGKIIYHKMQ